MEGLENNIGFINVIIDFIVGVLLWFVNILSSSFLALAGISIILLLLLIATIWAYQNKEKLHNYI